MRPPHWTLVAAALVLGALPLLAYPFVLLAGVMSLAAEHQGDTPRMLVVVALTFLWASLAHPLVYAACLGGSLIAWWAFDAKWVAFALAAGSVGYCIFLGLLMALWWLTEILVGTG